MRPIEASVDRCGHCGCPTARWLAYFCPKCSKHHDQLYCSESPSGRQRPWEAIAEEYHLAGMVTEAMLLAEAGLTEAA